MSTINEAKNKLEGNGIKTYHFSKIPTNFHNSRFIETNSLDTALIDFENAFKTGTNYTKKEIVDNIKTYLKYIK